MTKYWYLKHLFLDKIRKCRLINRHFSSGRYIRCPKRERQGEIHSSHKGKSKVDIQWTYINGRSTTSIAFLSDDSKKDNSIIC